MSAGSPPVSLKTQSGSLPKNPLIGKKAGVPGDGAIIARELFRQTAIALKLPNDSLSIMLLAFTRFFSLSPNPALIGELRREILALLKNPSQARLDEKSPIERAALEAETLASVIIADKGLALSPEALERYAAFLAPPAFTQEKKNEENSTGGGQGDGEGNQNDRDELPEPEKIRAIAEDDAKKNDLLDILNSVPGKNGQYWAVFPFKIKVKGIELKLFIRILKKERGSISNRLSPLEGEHLIADILSPKRQWRFFLEKTAAGFRADIRVYPTLSPRSLAALEKEARRFLDISEIRVQNGEEMPSWAEELCNESLPSINKEV